MDLTFLCAQQLVVSDEGELAKCWDWKQNWQVLAGWVSLTRHAKLLS